jgi:hypothetical protein
MKPQLCLVLLMALGLPAAQSSRPPNPAVPLDPIKAILDAFQSHSIVALGEPHGNEQAAAFRLALIRDARFADIVNDIVVESGNSRYQHVVDDFVSGQKVPDATLRQAWQNTTVANFLWERPIYEQFFRAVRDVNASLPKQKRLRLLLGDPPIDWSAVHTADDLLKWLLQRDDSAASIVRDQVLAKHRRALVIYGEGHFRRHNAGTNLVSRLEAGGTKVFTISTPIMADLVSIQPSIADWPTPSLALLAGTLIGAEDSQHIFAIPGTNANSLRFEDQIDAVLYLGPPSAMTTSKLPAALCTDERYVSMRLARMALDPGPPGSPPPAERLKNNCTTR